MIKGHSYKPTAYFAATFLATFVLWFAGAYVSFQDSSGTHMLLMLPGLMAPFLISLVFIVRSRHPELMRDFVNRLVNPRLIKPRTLPVLFLIMPLAVLVSILLSLLVGESTSQFQLAEGFSFSTGFVPVLLLLLMAAAFEELGWRGYAFDSLQSRFTLFTASIVFGLLWSLWHLPLAFVNHSYQYEIIQESLWFGLNFFVSIVPLGIIITWICIKNGKSVLAAVLFHFIVNISQEMLNMSQITKSIETGVLVVAAAAVIVLDKETFFSRGHLMGRTDPSTRQQTTYGVETGLGETAISSAVAEEQGQH